MPMKGAAGLGDQTRPKLNLASAVKRFRATPQVRSSLSWPLSLIPEMPTSGLNGQAIEVAPNKDPTPILCVEDDRATLLLLKRILGKRFSRVLFAEDGAAGLAIFNREHPPIVITDIYMPVMNGIDMARAIKAEDPRTHVIVITSNDESAAILAAVDVGVIDYVLKPIATERLNTAIDKCLQVSNLERVLRRSTSRTEGILESIGDAFFALQKDWSFTYLNKRAEDHFKIPRSKLLGSSFMDLDPELVGPPQAYAETMASQQKRSFELFVPGLERWHDVSIFPQDGGISVYLRDITEKKKHEDEIQSLAFHDKLTGLPNRALLQERLTHTIQWCKRTGSAGRFSLSIWTDSRLSTIPWATTPGIRSCRRWQGVCVPAFENATPWPDSAGTNLSFSWRGSSIPTTSTP